MAGRGPAPKPAHLRQRTNKKAGAKTLDAPTAVVIPKLGPHPKGEKWHPKTLEAWREFFESPMASEWLPTDVTGLRMVAALYDGFYTTGDIDYMKEIRLQRPCYGLTPLDRSRLQWETRRAEEPERAPKPATMRRSSGDPRRLLMAVK